jgi:hypothetical protein
LQTTRRDFFSLPIHFPSHYEKELLLQPDRRTSQAEDYLDLANATPQNSLQNQRGRMNNSHNVIMPVRIYASSYESDTLALTSTVYYRELTSCDDNE